MTVMCALRLLSLEQRLADDAVLESQTAQVRAIWQSTRCALHLNARVSTIWRGIE